MIRWIEFWVIVGNVTKLRCALINIKLLHVTESKSWLLITVAVHILNDKNALLDNIAKGKEIVLIDKIRESQSLNVSVLCVV